MSTTRLTKSRNFLISVIVISAGGCGVFKLLPTSHRALASAESTAFDGDGPLSSYGASSEDTQDASFPHSQCPDNKIWFNEDCYTAEELSEISKRDDESIVNELSQTDDYLEKAKAGSRLLKNQERAVDMADAKLDAILEDLRKEDDGVE